MYICARGETGMPTLTGPSTVKQSTDKVDHVCSPMYSYKLELDATTRTTAAAPRRFSEYAEVMTTCSTYFILHLILAAHFFNFYFDV